LLQNVLNFAETRTWVFTDSLFNRGKNNRRKDSRGVAKRLVSGACWLKIEGLMFPFPKCVFLTHGVGVHRHALTAFEYALRDADIEQQNLVTVSSILPPHCELISRATGVATLRPGEITFAVVARAETNEAGRRIAAGIGLARPKDPAHYGYISEHHAFGMLEAEMRDYVEDLAATMLASTLGVEFNPDAAWDERKRVYQMSDLIVDSLSITACAEGASNRDWTCAVAAAVFRFEATGADHAAGAP
jgi:arginine decarboxylase